MELIGKEDIEKLLSKEKYGFKELCDIMSMLRAENGCPWDREQDHRTIRQNFIEECYEAVEAIDKSDDALLCEELGDVVAATSGEVLRNWDDIKKKDKSLSFIRMVRVYFLLRPSSLRC